MSSHISISKWIWILDTKGISNLILVHRDSTHTVKEVPKEWKTCFGVFKDYFISILQKGSVKEFNKKVSSWIYVVSSLWNILILAKHQDVYIM